MLWSPKPLRGEANLARSFSGGIGGGSGGILSLSSLVGELVVLLPLLESLLEWASPLESMEWLPGCYCCSWQEAGTECCMCM